MSGDVFAFMESTAPWLVLWSLGFTGVTTCRIALRFGRGVARVPDNALLTELAGAPLTLLQTVCFVLAVWNAEWLTALLFLWWGPGFWFTVAMVLRGRLRQQRIDWHPYRLVISYLCKLTYLAYVTVFYVHGMPGMFFAFSVWIINDQYEKTWMSLDADRTRRTFHDGWLPRLLYPAGLLTPCLVDMPFRGLCAAYGLVLLGVWLAGLAYVARRGRFLALPDDPTLLRNMVYFPKLRVQGMDDAAPAETLAGAGR